MCKTLEEQMANAARGAVGGGISANAKATAKVAQIYALEQQINLLNKLSIDNYDEKEGLGGTYGDNYVGMKQINKRLSSLKEQLKVLKDGKE